MSDPTWPGVEHALAKAARMLTIAEGFTSGADARERLADQWRRLAETARELGYSKPASGPLPPLLAPGVHVRIAGPDVEYRVDPGLETHGNKATLTFTTVDSEDWEAERAAPKDDREVFIPYGPNVPKFAEGGVVNSPGPYVVGEEYCEPYVPAAAGSTLTVEPSSHIVLTVDPSRFDDEFVKLVRESLRVNGGGNVTVSFGDSDDDDGLAGVREPVRA